MALAARGKITEAEAESKMVADAEHGTPPEAPFGPLNSAKDILKIAEDVLAAKIVSAKRGSASAVPLLRDAISVQDALNYNEPPDWYFPVRESLGAALLAGGNASEAERVFREDLDRNPRNPRSLFGLREALKAQDRAYDAQFVDKEFLSAWKGNDHALKVEDLM
jgi:hypothetical protein